ncbi:collagen alpha-1(X) chain-like [Mercenaria mercenaria]|uniref:collagen alpha-1(X) chain-like n=1 Tax=Mercenaria mercenaria TaxID=6596 RepID=UPI001E1D665F|nr:collagen alpha-1(X) chain-like [Mercenaria mercenaria]
MNVCFGVFILLSVPFSSINGAYSENIETVVQKLTAQNEKLMAKIDKVDSELREEKARNNQLREKVDLLDAKLRLSGRKQTTRQLNDPTVAFTAVISPSDLTNLNAGQPIIFDRTITNMANAYDTSSGIFTAPIRGVYIFNMGIMVEPGENEYLQFVKDGAHVMYNYIHASGGLDDVSSSRTVVMELENGNQVWIRTTKSATHGSGNLHGNEFSTFSGWLLAITE